MSYERLDAAGLQWPCPATDDPGARLLHADTFALGPKARLQLVE
jgi:predicted molibdopterin-dependent oxidoreductase YjgC